MTDKIVIQKIHELSTSLDQVEDSIEKLKQKINKSKLKFKKGGVGLVNHKLHLNYNNLTLLRKLLEEKIIEIIDISIKAEDMLQKKLSVDSFIKLSVRTRALTCLTILKNKTDISLILKKCKKSLEIGIIIENPNIKTKKHNQDISFVETYNLEDGYLAINAFIERYLNDDPMSLSSYCKIK